MMEDIALNVYVDRYGSYALSGRLYYRNGGLAFKYDDSYLNDPDARSLFACLPLRADAHDEDYVQGAFSGLAPEGRFAEDLARRFGIDRDDLLGFLSNLSDETQGALVFCAPGKTPGETEDYMPLDEGFLEEFAAQPRTVGQRLLGAARLSLAGEMAKIGVYVHPETQRMFLPVGAAPSTHIVKASSGEYANQVLNEALCLECAKELGFDVADVSLIEVGQDQPLIMLSRFDRLFPDESLTVSGNPRPRRLHQQDFGQALGIKPVFKYDTMDGVNYPGLMRDALMGVSSNSFGEGVYLFESIMLRYFLGDCDGHIKNYALLANEAMTDWSISPTYDITCTTIYPQLDRHIGLKMGRRMKTVDEILPDDALSLCREMGVPEALGMREIRKMAQDLPAALLRAGEQLMERGFSTVETVVDRLYQDALPRVDRFLDHGEVTGTRPSPKVPVLKNDLDEEINSDGRGDEAGDPNKPDKDSFDLDTATDRATEVMAYEDDNREADLHEECEEVNRDPFDLDAYLSQVHEAAEVQRGRSLPSMDSQER